MAWYLVVSVVLLLASFLIRLVERDWFRRAYQDTAARVRRAPRGLVVIFSMLLVWAVAYGGSKPAGQSATTPGLIEIELTPLPVDEALVVYPEAQAPVQLEVREAPDAVPIDASPWPTEAPASNPLAPDAMLSGSSNLTRPDFPMTAFEAPAGLARWPFDAFTSNAIVGLAATAQPPIPDVMLATGLALHRVTTGQTLLTDEGGVSVHDWTRHGADNRAVWVETPFPVVIGTSSYSRVGILSNGRLAFGYGTYHRRKSAGLPIETPYPVVTVAPLWGPFALLPTTSRVWARSEGTNAFVIAWEAMLLGGNETHPATAQCVIGRDGTFRFLYGPQPDGAGNLTTVGAQNQGYGWCYSNSHSNRVQEAMAVSLRPAALDGWAEADPDGDSISNYEEFMLGTDPALADSDADGPSDRWELEHGFDPTVAQLADPDPDTDGDLIPDGWEAWMGSDPNNPNSGRWDCMDTDGDGFVAWYEWQVFGTSDSQGYAPGPVDEDHVDVIAVVDSTRPCVLTLTGPGQAVDIPWVPGVSPANLQLRLTRGEQYEVVLSRAPAGSGLSTNGFWWANVHFEAPPEFWGLNGPETVTDGVLAYNAHTVRIETPFRPSYDLWLNPGATFSPFFDLAALTLAIDGPLVFCHNTTYGQIALTANSLVTGPVDWTGLPPVTPAQANPLVFDPSTVTPGSYNVVAVANDNPWVWAECQVEIHSLAFAESVIWLSTSDTNAHTIALAPGSFPTTGLYVTSVPEGITSLDVTPSELDPGIYTVYAWGACGGAEVVVRVVRAELKVTHPHNPGPTGAPAKYNFTPGNGSAGNLFSTWDGEPLRIDVVLEPAYLASSLPSDFITWAAAGFSISNNTVGYTFTWSATGKKEVTVGFPRCGITRKVTVDVPDVGSLSEQDALAALYLVSSVIPGSIIIYGVQARSHVNDPANGFGPPFGHQRWDAFRHAYWNALCVSDTLVTSGMTRLVTTGHEWNNKQGISATGGAAVPQQAFNTTMDLHNNAVGRTCAHTTLLGRPDVAQITADITARYTAGDLWIWDGPPRTENTSEGMLRKSNGATIY